LKKQHASSDKKTKEKKDLPSDTLWRAAELVCQNGTALPSIDAEPTPQEMLGTAIGILRRRKHISHLQFAQRIGCSVEELLALEAGLLPAKDYIKSLPLILESLEIPEKALQPFLAKIKYA
jgi:hypothetical protein